MHLFAPLRFIALAVAALVLIAPSWASAQQISFSSGWKEQRFSLFSSNDYSLGRETLGIRSDGSVSLLWSALPESLWNSMQAAWDWAVETSVPATDLTQKGGDDRNVSLYFLFLPEAAAQEARNEGIRSLLNNPEARVLVYVWGGAHGSGQVLPSPYLGDRGRTIVLRGSGTGATSERVDLKRDHQRAFGEAPAKLVGLAVSSDSDDTDTAVVASLSRLRLR